MITVSKIQHAGQAVAYYQETDDYYREGGAAPAFFAGEGARVLGLEGAMTKASACAFARILEGTIDGAQIGQAQRHTPGWDVTFSAPKSVSVAALVNRDERLVDVHDAAVKAALQHLERHAVVTRQRAAGGEYEWKHAGMTAAVYRHETNRNCDPQLHAHAVIANAVRVDGQWRSLDSREIYNAQAEANAVYMSELARGARAAGYTVEWKMNERGHAAFELREVPEHLREAFSSRSREIEAALAARGLTRASASAEAKQATTLATRKVKQVHDRVALAEAWRAVAREQGHDIERRPQSRAPETESERNRAAAVAVGLAMEHLSERDARFSVRALRHEALNFGHGEVALAQVAAEIARREAAGQLEQRTVITRVAGGKRGAVEGYTTREGIELERALIERAGRMAQTGGRIAEPAGAGDTQRQVRLDALLKQREAVLGRVLSDEQRSAIAGQLERPGQLKVLHGLAGTAKTTSVLATITEAARAAGWRIEALAPTGSAAQTLGTAIGSEGRSVAHLLATPAQTRDPHAKPEPALWIIDEAGMVSARDMHALLARAEVAQAHLVLVGDTKQIGSVGAGAAFEQIIEAIGTTGNLREIVRQREDSLREAVHDAAAGRVQAALERIEPVVQKDRAKAIETIAQRHVAALERGKDVLTVTLSRADRETVNSRVQELRERAGAVRGARPLEVLVAKSWTEAERKDVARYQVGDRIIFRRAAGPDGPAAGEVLRVAAADTHANRLQLDRVDADGKRTTYALDPRTMRGFEVAEARALRVGAGDQIVAKGKLVAERENGGRLTIPTGARMTVERLEQRTEGAQKQTTLHIQTESGTRAKIDLGKPQRIDLGYVMTADQAQGKTCDVALGYMRSSQSNLAAQTRLYVTISRAKEQAVLYTNDPDKLAKQLQQHRGNNATALERPGQQTARVEPGKLAQRVAELKRARKPRTPERAAEHAAPGQLRERVAQLRAEQNVAAAHFPVQEPARQRERGAGRTR